LFILPAYFKNPRKKRQVDTIPFQGFPLGENTSVQADMIDSTEMAECIDFKIKPGGTLEARKAIVKYTDTAIDMTGGGATIGYAKTCSIGGEYVDLVSAGTPGGGYDLFYLSVTDGSGVTPVKIDDIMGQAQITAYNDVGIISDGSYLKFCDSTTSVNLGYDSGPGGTFFDNFDGDLDGTIAVTTAGVGCTFTTPAWDAGFTIPPTQVYFYGVATTTSATMTIDIVSTGGTTISSTPYDGIIPSSSADMLDVYITTAQVSNQLSPSTAYFCLLKSDSFTLSYSTATAGAMVTAAGATSDSTKQPKMRIHPGLPPKSEWTIVSDQRLWVYDPDRKGGLWYGHLSHLDFSTVNGGGWVGVVDEDQNSYRVGAAEDLYGEMYVYGTEDQPYICKRTGATPEEYKITPLFQRVWATPKTIKNTGNDLFTSSKVGIDSLTGVQEYGDLRFFDIATPIKERFSSWNSTTAIAGHNARNGQYWLYMTGDYVNICHTKIPIKDASGQIRYPWSRYKLPITPTFMGLCGDKFLIGCADGFIYEESETAYLDLGTTAISPSVRTAYMDFPFQTNDLRQIHVIAGSMAGATMNVSIYKNGNLATPILVKSVSIGANDSLTINDLLNTTISEYENVGILSSSNPSFFDVNINARSFQIKIDNILVGENPFHLNGLVVKYEILEA